MKKMVVIAVEGPSDNSNDDSTGVAATEVTFGHSLIRVLCT